MHHRNNHYILYFQNSIPKDDFLHHPCFELKIVKKRGILNKGIVWQLYTVGKAAKRDDLDIFFSPHYLLPLIKLQAKKVVGMWDIYFYVHPQLASFRSRIYNKLFMKKVACQADLILTCSHFDKNEIVQHLYVAEDKVKVTYLAQEDKFKPISDVRLLKSFKSKYNFKDRYFLYVGLIFKRRFQDVVIRAFQRVLKEYEYTQNSVGLVLVGPNRTYPYIDIRALIDKFNPGGAIQYIDFFPEEEMVQLYSAAHASLYLSSYEGEGIPLKEAMACGTPVITSPVLQEVIGEKERAGYLIENPADEDELFETFRSILRDEKRRKGIIKKGLTQVSTFSWKNCAEQTMKLFYEVNRNDTE